MTSEDFAIDIDALPKLTLNEDKGRALLRHLLSVKAYQNCVYAAKLAAFVHHCSDHLKLSITDFPASRDDYNAFKRQMPKFFEKYPNLEPVWENISKNFDRHLFLVITAYASMEDNIVNEDDVDMVDCPVWPHTVSDIAFCGFEAHAIAATLSGRVFKAINARDMERGLDAAISGALAMNAVCQSVRVGMRLYVTEAVNEDYGKGTVYRNE